MSRLESFAACPFKHFARHTLALRGRDEEEVTARDLGGVYHNVLENLVRRAIGERPHALDDPDALEPRLPEVAREIGSRLRGGILEQDARGRYLLGRVERTLRAVIEGQRAAARLGRFRPSHAELTFGGGDDAALPPLRWRTPKDRRVRVHGRIDRLDVTPTGDAALVVDYKATARDPQLARGDVFHRLSLQLLVYLLVVQEHGGRIADPPPQPAAGLYVKLLRGLTKSADPADEPRPGEETFDLRCKPRGVIDYDALPLLDSGFANESADAERHQMHRSDGFNAQTKKDGDPYAKCDVLESEAFDDLLMFVRRQVRELADAVLDGEVRPRPYKRGRQTPCPACDYASVCRFEPREQYVRLDTPKDVHKAIADAAAQERREAVRP